MEKYINGYCISSDKAKLDLKVIHNFLSSSYWSRNISFETVKRSIDNSLSIGAYFNDTQVGFARVITDFATFAYIADVFVVENKRGKGIAKMIMRFIVDHPELQGLRRWMLATKDAHGLYTQFNFKPLNAPDRWMEIHKQDVYANES